MAEFTDEASIEAWLKDQPHQVAIHLAARSALRALPGLGFVKPDVLPECVLPVLRATLTSATAAACSRAIGEDIKRAAHSSALGANNAARFLAAAATGGGPSEVSGISAALAGAAAADVPLSGEVHSAAVAASLSGSEAALSAEMTPAMVADLRRHGGGASSLWPDRAEPTDRLQGRIRLFEFFATDDAIWGFWKRWYLAVLAGDWTDWDLCRQVALIPDEVWQEGPAAVAEAIQRLIGDRTPLNGEAARRQAEILRNERQSASLCAEGLARYLDGVIQATKRIRNDGLPEPFEPIEALAIRLFKLSQDVLSEGPESDPALAKLLQGSAADVAGLVRKLREAEAELARLRTELDKARDDIALKNRLLEAGFKNPKIDWLRDFVLPASAAAAGTVAPIYLPQLFGAIGSGASYLLGPDIKELVAALSQCYADFVRPEVVPDLPLPATVPAAVEA
ncbi:hypothetical protein [Mangrovicoccus algicola]|uniref:Uncharacterized protein n=1 Tax=Mangrovicoccus algicola TaxID=2771008 RepID=A0A8J7CI09_9RHOB|nr:hypothetical protein [Mangrovicoccus algicola]MBE3638985.1 hypothetical protein [Mangrovicoccus algicola]